MRERLGVWLLVALAAVSLTGCVDLSARTPAGPPIASARDVASPKTPAELVNWCQLTVAASDWDQALPACERVAVEAPDTPGLPDWLVRIYLAKGRAALSPGDVAQALRWFDRAHDLRPDLAEVGTEYALALAYRGAEAAAAAGRWDDALARFQAVYAADPLYLAWLPESAPRRRAADVQVSWGEALIDERALDEAESHCAAAARLVADLAAATDCLATVTATRAPTPTPTPTVTPTRVAPPAPVLPRAPQPPAPPRPPAPAAAPAAATPAAPAAAPPTAAPVVPAAPAPAPATPVVPVPPAVPNAPLFGTAR